jgi:hypothetical protein
MIDDASTLTRLGDALEHAAAADLARSRRHRRRRLAMAIACTAIAVPGLAVAADRLIDPGTVARSMPAGTLALAGTEPACSVVEDGVEYHCVLAHPPAPEVADWKGTVEPTVDDTKHVNGGCRALTSDGLEWQCYLGSAAVEQGIVSQGFLGEYAPTPGVG